MSEPEKTAADMPAKGSHSPPAYEGEKAGAYDSDRAADAPRKQSVAANEAADVYGNADDAEEFGYVERGYAEL
jgi:hypothetical protein